MDMARAAARRSTCYRLNVGAILVDRTDQNVVAMGYNGAPSGQPHCSGNGCRYFSSSGCLVIHAERNALNRLRGDWTPGSLSAYITHSPCGACAREIVGGGLISDVYFEIPYRDPSPIQMLLGTGQVETDEDDASPARVASPGRSRRVRVFQLLPSGLAVDQSTGQLVELE